MSFSASSSSAIVLRISAQTPAQDPFAVSVVMGNERASNGSYRRTSPFRRTFGPRAAILTTTARQKGDYVFPRVPLAVIASLPQGTDMLPENTAAVRISGPGQRYVSAGQTIDNARLN